MEYLNYVHVCAVCFCVQFGCIRIGCQIKQTCVLTNTFDKHTLNTISLFVCLFVRRNVQINLPYNRYNSRRIPMHAE